MTEKTRTGVLLLNFGGPEILSDVEPFLGHIFGGRIVPPLLLEKVKERYQAIGGGSPLVSVTRRQAQRLEEELNSIEDRFRVFFGMLHSRPFISDTLRHMAEEGVEQVVALSMAPFFSRASTGAYYKAVSLAGQDGLFKEIIFAGPWFGHNLFTEAVAERILECSGKCLVFSAHSLPEEDDTAVYEAQLREAVQDVVSLFPGVRYRLAYQSRGGGKGRWLGPSVEEVFEDLARENEKDIVLVPIGFASDHVETLYDLDIQLKQHTDSLGIDFYRCPALNDSPLFIKLLASVVKRQLGNGMVK